jgi:hypothetical protein
MTHLALTLSALGDMIAEEEINASFLDALQEYNT